MMSITRFFCVALFSVIAGLAFAGEYPVPKPSSPEVVLPGDMKPIVEPKEDLPENVKKFSGAWEGAFATGGTTFSAVLVIHEVALEKFTATYLINKRSNPVGLERKGDGIYAGTLPSGRYLRIRHIGDNQLEVDIGGTPTWFTRVPMEKKPA